VIISPSLPSTGTILNDYYIHQSGKGYPVFAGRRYQRGHGLGSIFGGLFKAAMPLLKNGAKTLGREALKTDHHSSSFEWHYGTRVVRYIYFHGLKFVVVTGDSTVSDQTLG
jgi:hypothetical protein